jgi:hypothetical protein
MEISMNVATAPRSSSKTPAGRTKTPVVPFETEASLNANMRNIVTALWSNYKDWLGDFCVWLLISPSGCQKLWSNSAYEKRLRDITVAFDLNASSIEFLHVAQPLLNLREEQLPTDQLDRHSVQAATFIAVCGLHLAKVELTPDVATVAGLVSAAVDTIAVGHYGSISAPGVDEFKLKVVEKIRELVARQGDPALDRFHRAAYLLSTAPGADKREFFLR